MMAVTVCRRPRVSGIDHERSEHPDDADYVRQGLALVPLASCFGERLRKAIVERPSEELLAAVEAPRLQEPSVRMMPSASKSSVPMRFWPPSPRVSARNATRA